METRLPPKQKIVGSTPAGIVVDCIFGVVNINFLCFKDIRKKDIRFPYIINIPTVYQIIFVFPNLIL